MGKYYATLLEECKKIQEDKFRLTDATAINWEIGRKTHEYVKKRMLGEIKEYQLIKKLSHDLCSTQIPAFLNFYREYPDLNKRRKKLTWALYYHLLSLPKKERTFYEKKLLSGEIKNREELRAILRRRRQNA